MMINKKTKTVTFNSTIQVKNIHHWLFAHREARKGMNIIIIDRIRFSDKIQKIKIVLDVILKENHRIKIFNSRFK